MSSKKAPLLHHLIDLRKRMVYAIAFTALTSFISYLNSTHMSAFFTQPFHQMLPSDASLNIQTIYEGFFVKLKLSVVMGVILGLPFSLFQCCRFLFPGLTKNEKKWVIIIISFSSLLSIFSTYMGYAIVFPYIIQFLTTAQFIPNDVNVLLNYKQNINYIISFLFAGIIIFQTPIILELLLAKSIITRQFLLKNARWFIVGIVISAAIITPPDIISQLSLAIPLIICYFLCILVAKVMGWGK